MKPTYNKISLLTGVLAFILTSTAVAQNTNTNKFRQLGQELATPNVYRTASGAPGHLYWQQKVDYDMDIVLDDENQRISGNETITYTNNSPDELTYLWVQLDQNMRHPESNTYKIRGSRISDGIGLYEYFSLFHTFPGGFNIEEVKSESGEDFSVKVNHTMMRIDLDESLKTGESIKIKIKWWYNINDRMEIGGRSGYEYFEEDNNYLYTIAQFFPRMAVYSDVEGWQNKQFLGRGEFALPFGDYDVRITAPDDMILGGTGEIQNLKELLTSEQLERMEAAKSSDSPIIIVTHEEAVANEQSHSTKTKEWHFIAHNVRDFGWAASRKFLWDAQGVQFGDRTVLAMSLYPKEGNPLWGKYSTKAVALTLEVYSKYTFDYPYPVAYSVHAASIGMEYPMICFNFGRPNANGEYSDNTKYRMIGVIIHEVGHNFFPMIINSDERQWTWMDEGLNTFCQYLTEVEWTDETGKAFPSRRGPADKIIPYMSGDKRYISPIMTNSESIRQFGNNAYGKPATALNILRETVMGPELFDYAFKTYAQRWMFKHPSPSDFFRTMEDASAVDLDWFWRGWFYTNDHCDLSLDEVKEYQYVPEQPGDNDSRKKIVKRVRKKRKKGEFDPILESAVRTNQPVLTYQNTIEGMSDRRKNMLHVDDYFYELTFSNIGGLVMPVILKFVYEDWTSEEIRIPAEVFKLDETVTKVFITDKRVVRIVLDPNKEIADVDKSNNYWPLGELPSEFQPAQ
ncbi:MAG: M1 family metallopeptidase [Bacteroidia bacterium]